MSVICQWPFTSHPTRYRYCWLHPFRAEKVEKPVPVHFIYMKYLRQLGNNLICVEVRERQSGKISGVLQPVPREIVSSSTPNERFKEGFQYF